MKKMKLKSKLILGSTSLLALGVVAATAGTFAWYSAQASVDVNIAQAHISTPTDMLTISEWAPFGNSGSASTTTESKLTYNTDLDLTEVMSTKAEDGGDTTASTPAASGEEGKFFTKYGLGDDGIVTPGSDNNYNVSMNPYVKQASVDDPVDEWALSSSKAAGSDLQLKSAKSGRAFLRIGFSLNNISQKAIKIIVTKQTWTISHADADDNANAARLLIKESVLGTTGAGIDNIPVGVAVKEDSPTQAPKQYTALGLGDTSGVVAASVAAGDSVHFVCTMWVEGADVNKTSYTGANYLLDLSFTAIALA